MNKHAQQLVAGLIQGVGMALAFIVLILALTATTGNQVQHVLSQIRDVGTAQVCVLTLKQVDGQRDEGQTNSRCLMPYGLPAADLNGNGAIELETP